MLKRSGVDFPAQRAILLGAVGGSFTAAVLQFSRMRTQMELAIGRNDCGV